MSPYDAQRDKVLAHMRQLLAMAIGHAVNFARPDRLVLSGDLTRHANFAAHQRRQTTGRIFNERVERMQIQVSADDCAATAETAAGLALARVIGRRA